MTSSETIDDEDEDAPDVPPDQGPSPDPEKPKDDGGSDNTTKP